MSANDRLSMLDEYGGRRQIIPAEVKGWYRRRRSIVHLVLLVIFLGLPWLQINGTQAILLDIPGRRFEFFGSVFLSHDSPLLFFILAISVLAIMLTTALWGRVWCGWACPQTVFIEAIFRRIEYFVEGNYIQRRKLYDSTMTLEKFAKYSFKWVLFFIFSSLFAHSFVAYFTGSHHLIQMMQGAPRENWAYFLVVGSVTALLLFNFGWFREQFCIIMCPYGRFQSVLMDQQSLSIVYSQARGEPRKGISLAAEKKGDCVSCNRCVQVCPTGIDIRNGSQMECIGCTACIDACDEIMMKVKKPTGLISYSSNVPKDQVRYFRPRIVAYLVLIIFCTTGLTYNLTHRDSFSAVLLRGTDVPYQMTPDGNIVNHFKVNLHNQSLNRQYFEISISDSSMKLTQSGEMHDLGSGDSKEVHVFISFRRSALNRLGKVPLVFQVKETTLNETRVIEVTGVGPYSSEESTSSEHGP